MTENFNKNIIKMQAKYNQTCKGCSQTINLIEKVTYMCTKCNFYFCEDCANFYNENESGTKNNCPGGDTDPHESIMVKITRNIKEYSPIGIGIDELEKKKTQTKNVKSTLKILDDKSSNDVTNKKSKLKILDD